MVVSTRTAQKSGYIAPSDKLEGDETTIFADRKRKLERARLRRKANYKSDISMVKSVAINDHSDYLNLVGGNGDRL